MAYYKNTQNGKNLNFMTFFFHSTGQCRGVLKIALFSKFRALWYVVAATQKTFLEYQSDKEKIGFRLVPISCSISENMLSLSYSMFSYFVVVSYPHWFKFCQKCDIKFRIHNYHFFHKQNPIVLSNFLWKNHLWSMDCQRGDAFLDVNLGSVPLCITSWSILSFSCGYILICFL